MDPPHFTQWRSLSAYYVAFNNITTLDSRLAAKVLISKFRFDMSMIQLFLKTVALYCQIITHYGNFFIVYSVSVILYNN